MTRLQLRLTLLPLIAAPALSAGSAARADEATTSILAVQLRKQGFACPTPVSATRDSEDARPDEAAWIVDCGTARYRMRLVPDMAAEVKVLSAGAGDQDNSGEQENR